MHQTPAYLEGALEVGGEFEVGPALDELEVRVEVDLVPVPGAVVVILVLLALGLNLEVRAHLLVPSARRNPERVTTKASKKGKFDLAFETEKKTDTGAFRATRKRKTR